MLLLPSKEPLCKIVEVLAALASSQPVLGLQLNEVHGGRPSRRAASVEFFGRVGWFYDDSWKLALSTLELTTAMPLPASAAQKIFGLEEQSFFKAVRCRIRWTGRGARRRQFHAARPGCENRKRRGVRSHGPCRRQSSLRAHAKRNPPEGGAKQTAVGRRGCTPRRASPRLRLIVELGVAGALRLGHAFGRPGR